MLSSSCLDVLLLLLSCGCTAIECIATMHLEELVQVSVAIPSSDVSDEVEESMVFGFEAFWDGPDVAASLLAICSEHHKAVRARRQWEANSVILDASAIKSSQIIT